MAQAKATPARRAAFGNRLSELTTIFSPPCPVTWLITTTKVPSQYPPFPTTGPTSCDPPFWADNIAQKGFGYYSPAICPSGFVVGCTASNDRSGEGFPAITAGETAMYCVPRQVRMTSGIRNSLTNLCVGFLAALLAPRIPQISAGAFGASCVQNQRMVLRLPWDRHSRSAGRKKT